MRRTTYLIALLALVCIAPPARAQAQRPNIVFLLADDLRWNALGCMGDRQIRTPAIDHLAQRGLLFNNCFVTTSICCVSRASIFSGQYERRHGIGNFSTPFTAQQWQNSYPALLRAAGYRTGFIGKFGVGNAKEIAAMAPAFDYWRGLPGQGGLFYENNNTALQHKTALFGDQSLEFLRANKPGQPFCLSVSFIAPHCRDGQPREFWPDVRDETLYQQTTIPQPPTASEQYFERLPKALRESEGRRRWEKRFADGAMFQRVTRDYYRLVSGIDREVGRIVAELDRLNLRQNTIIVFSSDNGFFFGERGLAGKWLMYEESLRVPLIIVDPRLPASQQGRSTDAMALNIDLAPTFLDLAGIAEPGVMQGRSLLPVTNGQAAPDWRTAFYYEHHFGPTIIPPSEGVRTTRYSYIRWVNEKPVLEELYDVQADPLEEHNLIADPAHQVDLQTLRKQYEAFHAELK